MTRQERISGIVFTVVGFAIMAYSAAFLQIGTISKPGTGFFPIIAGTTIAFLSIWWIMSNRGNYSESKVLWGKEQLIKPAVAIAIALGYAGLMEFLGYILSTLVFLVAWEIAIEREKWLKTAVIAIVGTATMYVLFVYLLGVALPDGFFSE